MNPYFLLAGFPGSGRRLLTGILNAHPQMIVAPPIHWILLHFETRRGMIADAVMAPQMVHKWSDQNRFELFGVAKEDLNRLVDEGKPIPFPEFLTRLCDLHGNAKGKRHVGCLADGYVQILPALHALWPDAKVIHLIRDGRNISLLNAAKEESEDDARRAAAWTEDPIVMQALCWKQEVGWARQGGLALPKGRYHEIFYEALASRPAEECAKLCSFLGIEFDNAMLRFHAEYTKPAADGTSLEKGSALSRDWRTQMPADEVERFEAAAGDLLAELGYSRAVPKPRAEAVKQIDRLSAVMTLKPSPLALAERRREQKQKNPFVFLVGCPRSGTTLLQRLVDAHPEIALGAESFWLPYFYKSRIGLTVDGLVTPDLIDKLLGYYKFYRMKAGRPELQELLEKGGERQSYADFVSAIFDLYGDFRGKPLVGDKTPDYIRDLPTLHALWPQAKFVHLIRDGRDTILSAINWKRKAAKFSRIFPTWAEHPVATAAIWWEWNVRLGLEAGRAMSPDRYFELRYEALVAQPAEECAKLCAFLGLSYDEAMLRFHEGHTRTGEGLDAKRSWKPITAGLRDWRTQMSAEDAECFEAAAGEMLEKLGYPLTVACPRPELVQQADHIRESFIRHAASLEYRLP